MTSCFPLCCCPTRRNKYEVLEGDNGQEKRGSLLLKTVKYFASGRRGKKLPFSPTDLMDFISDPDHNLYVGFGYEGSIQYSKKSFQLTSAYANTHCITIEAIQAISNDTLIFTHQDGKGYTIEYTLFPWAISGNTADENGSFFVDPPQIFDGGLCFPLNPRTHVFGTIRDRLILSYNRDAEYPYC